MLGRTLWDFEGAWAVARAIRHDDGRRAAFEGVARAGRDGEGLAWREAGRLAMDGRSWEAERRTLWRPSPEGAPEEVQVLFEDGRPFHRIDLREDRPAGTHPCGRDLYRVRYDFGAWPEWTATWRVDGPRHAYAMLSRHAPLAGEALAGDGALGHSLGPGQAEGTHEP